MDAAGRRELIEGLCAFEHRGPGTDAERRAANWLGEQIRGLGRKAKVEPIHVHPEYSLVVGLHLVLAIAGSLVAVLVPAAGFAMILLAATSLYLDQNTRLYLLRRLFFRRASQNVVSPGSDPEAPLRVVLTAHYDAAKTGFIFGSRSQAIAKRIPQRARIALGPLRILFWGAVVPLLATSALRMAGVDPGWLGVVQLLPTVVALVGVALAIDIALSEVVPGACDNASGVAAVLAAADELAAEPPRNLDLWVILPGGEECNAEGMAAYFRAHRKELDRSRTVFVNVDSVSFGTPHCVIAEGAVVSYPMDRRLVDLCAGLDGGGGPPPPIRVPLHTDALAARARGFSAISLVGAKDGLGAPYYHTLDDTPARADDAALARAADLTVGLVRAIDEDLDLRGAPPKAAVTAGQV